MSLRTAARNAWLGDQQSSEAEARTALAGVLGDQPLVDGLTTLHADVGKGFVRWFFEDSEGLRLRVSRRASDGQWTVNLVEEREAGEWTDLGQVTDLKRLWEILPGAGSGGGAPEMTPWAVGETVVPRDVRSYDGLTYECRQGHTTQAGWEPPNTPALWEAIS